MKVTFSPGNNLQFEIEGDSQTAIIEQIAPMQEIFGISQCGACKSKNIRWQVRKVLKEEGKKSKEYTYYELVCNDCRARLAFGQFSDGSGNIFPKKKDEDGKWLENNGWVVFKGKKPEAEPKSESSDGVGF